MRLYWVGVSVGQENALPCTWSFHMRLGNGKSGWKGMGVGTGGHSSLAAKVKHAVTRFIYYKICKRAAL